MKITIFSLLLSLMGLSAFSQIGIVGSAPSATLDIEALNTTGTSTNVDGLLIPRVDRERAQSMTGVPTSTLVYINDVSTGSLSDTAVNIDTVGYYYFDEDVWAKLASIDSSNSNPNIYNTDGTLTENRTITQSAYTLAFTGTKVNSFSVDDSTFSVDSSNNRVGIGTITPEKTLHVSATADPLKLTGLQESTTYSGSLNIDNTGVVHIRDSSSLSAVTVSGNITFTANNTEYKINNTSNPTIIYDNLGEFSGNAFTATDTGIYSVKYILNFIQRSSSNDAGDGYMGIINLLLNDSRYLRSYAYVSPTQSGSAPVYVTAILPVLVKMDAGDILAFTTATYGATISSSSTAVCGYQISITRID